MNRLGINPNAVATREEMRSSAKTTASIPVSGRPDTVVCPKPRRIGLINGSVSDHPVRSLRWLVGHQVEAYESKAGSEILDIILTKDGFGAEQACKQVASSPPFFSGSPPSRVSNPVTQDARFRDELIMSPLTPIPPPSGLTLSPSSSSTRKGGCVRSNFGNNPSVRIVGSTALTGIGETAASLPWHRSSHPRFLLH